MQSKAPIVLILGGSLVVPDRVDTVFLARFYEVILKYLESGLRFIMVVGGGALARQYQIAFRDLIHTRDMDVKQSNDAQDRVGIRATQVNAQLVRELFVPHAEEQIVSDPTAESIRFEKAILVAAGWKPGFSTDLDAVKLAQRYAAQRIINLTNIEKIYSADPNADSSAVPLDEITWQELLELTGKTWTPGLKVPFDPVAVREAMENNLEAITALGTDMDNVCNIIENKKYIGTRIYS